jgi:hypothetical protein
MEPMSKVLSHSNTVETMTEATHRAAVDFAVDSVDEAAAVVVATEAVEVATAVATAEVATAALLTTNNRVDTNRLHSFHSAVALHY